MFTVPWFKKKEALTAVYKLTRWVNNWKHSSLDFVLFRMIAKKVICQFQIIEKSFFHQSLSINLITVCHWSLSQFVSNKCTVIPTCCQSKLMMTNQNPSQIVNCCTCKMLIHMTNDHCYSIIYLYLQYHS